MSDKKRGTFIHGIAASEHIDSSGERIQIEGVDITSLTKDGTFNYEHDSKSPSSIVGKIWEAKKILKRSDCENEHQKEFWDKLKMPFIYVAGELFDAVGHQAAGEVAAMLRYDGQESLNKEAKKLINFSIEGSRVEKQGAIITKCIARKVSVTLTPCNKVCEAYELKMDDKAEKQSDSGKFAFIQDVMSKADEASCQIMKGEVPFLYKADLNSPPGSGRTPKRIFSPQNAPSTMHVGDKISYVGQPKAKTGTQIYGKMPKQKPSWQKSEKKKLGKYESNVRKALVASCGAGVPSTKVQDISKSEYVIVRFNESDINKASFNVRQQRKKVFGTNSQPAAKSAMRDKHIAHIKNFVDKFLGLDLQPSGGKVNDKTGERRKADNEIGVDKPDWRSGKFEAQWNPEAIVHEIAHLMLMPEGVNLEDGQRLMDKQYSDVQKEHGYMQQKRSQGEVQPMAAEQLIRRFLGMPASQVSIPVKDKNAPLRTSVEDPNKVIATRVKVPGKKEKYVDLIRQSRNLTPEHKQRLQDIFSGNLKFHPDKGWAKGPRSLDAAITNRQPGAVLNRQAQKQASQELPPNVVRMKPRPAPMPMQPQIAQGTPAPMPMQQQKAVGAPAPMPTQPAAPQPAPKANPMKIVKSEQRKVMKKLGDQAYQSFDKKEELNKFLAETLPNVSEKERKSLAKAVAYVHQQKKESVLRDMMKDKEDKDE